MKFDPKKLKKMREEKGYSIEDIASKMRRTSATIRNWEKGKFRPGHGDEVLLETILRKRKKG